MNGLLIFDHLNDIIYTKYNKKFLKHIKEFAISQGLIENNEEENEIGENAFVQIFSPIITSQRIMSCQFGNSYTSIQCEDNINMCFEEFMGYLFLYISPEDVQTIKKYLSVCVTISRYLCGPDVNLLKTNHELRNTFTTLLETWKTNQNEYQSVYVEAIEQLLVNSDLSSITIQILRKSVDKLITLVEYQKIHAMIMVDNKLLSLYSSQTAQELSPCDTLFCTNLSLMCSEISTFSMFLTGTDDPKCLPHIIHIIPLSKGINLLYLFEIGNRSIYANLYESFCFLHSMQIIQIQRDVNCIKPCFENLDSAVKRLNEGLKKNKIQSVDQCGKQLMKKWEIVRKKYIDFIKTQSDEAILRAETLALGFLENLKQLFSLLVVDKSILQCNQKDVVDVSNTVAENLTSYNDFFKVKALRNFTLGSKDSLTINKYLEEFPGLVHFIYVDRNNHRLIAPTLDFNSDEANKLTKKKIWQMIKFAWNHLQDGNLSLMWKDTTFNYAYFLWFEDQNGTALKPIIYPTNSTKALPVPGLICGDFYKNLKEVCFPKTPAPKIRCYELFCIHLGLVTASCVLEHTRRLAATIWELRGHPSNPIDLL